MQESFGFTQASSVPQQVQARHAHALTATHPWAAPSPRALASSQLRRVGGDGSAGTKPVVDRQRAVVSAGCACRCRRSPRLSGRRIPARDRSPRAGSGLGVLVAAVRVVHLKEGVVHQVRGARVHLPDTDTPALPSDCP